MSFAVASLNKGGLNRVVAFLLFALSLTSCAAAQPTCETLNFEAGPKADETERLVIGAAIEIVEYHAENLFGIEKGEDCTVQLEIVQRAAANGGTAGRFTARLISEDSDISLGEMKTRTANIYIHKVLFDRIFAEANIASERPALGSWSIDDVVDFSCGFSTPASEDLRERIRSILSVDRRRPIILEAEAGVTGSFGECGGRYLILVENGYDVRTYNRRTVASAIRTLGMGTQAVVQDRWGMLEDGEYRFFMADDGEIRAEKVGSQRSSATGSMLWSSGSVFLEGLPDKFDRLNSGRITRLQGASGETVEFAHVSSLPAVFREIGQRQRHKEICGFDIMGPTEIVRALEATNE